MLISIQFAKGDGKPKQKTKKHVAMRGCQNKQFAFFHLNIPVHYILVILVANVY